MPTSPPISSPMSPAQVAHATNTSRRTVMRAIESQELKAFRDNRNHWKITAQDVEQWALAQCVPTEHVHQTPTVELSSAHTLPISSELTVALETERQARRLIEVEAAELRGKLAATEAERDRLHGIIQNWTVTQVKRRRWWPF